MGARGQWVSADRPARCASSGMVPACGVSNLSMWLAAPPIPRPAADLLMPSTRLVSTPTQQHLHSASNKLQLHKTAQAKAAYLLMPSTRLVSTPTPLPTVRSYSSCRAGGGSRGLAVYRPQQLGGSHGLWQSQMHVGLQRIQTDPPCPSCFRSGSSGPALRCRPAKPGHAKQAVKGFRWGRVVSRLAQSSYKHTQGMQATH